MTGTLELSDKTMAKFVTGDSTFYIQIDAESYRDIFVVVPKHVADVLKECYKLNSKSGSVYAAKYRNFKGASDFLTLWKYKRRVLIPLWKVFVEERKEYLQEKANEQRTNSDGST